MFPRLKPDMWNSFRPYYSGGFTFVNPKFNNVVIKNNVKQYDVNSLYPHTMENYYLPYGLPLSKNVVDKIPNNDLDEKHFTLWKITLLSDLHLKDGYIPFIGKKNIFKGKGSEYLKTLDMKDVPILNLPSPIKLLFEKYYTGSYDMEPEFVFKVQRKFFEDYFEHWKEKKKNGGVDKVESKLMMNSLYGKYGQKIFFDSYKFTICHKTKTYSQELFSEKTDLTKEQQEDKVGKYIPVAIATSSFAKAITIKAVQQNAENFIYCDTDSMHLRIDNDVLPDGIDIDDDRFGAWKNEWDIKKFGYVIEAVYSGAKRYMVRFKKDGKPYNIVKVAGITNDDWKQKQTAKSFKKHIDFQIKIKEACLQKKSYIRVNDENLKLPGVFLKKIDKTLK